MAIGMGLLPNKPLSKHARLVIKAGQTLQVPPMVHNATNWCAVVENPTAMLEQQRYMQPHSMFLRHVT